MMVNHDNMIQINIEKEEIKKNDDFCLAEQTDFIAPEVINRIEDTINGRKNA
jgi:hypothetical protein